MKTAVISYSLTGNNDALAEKVAEVFGAAHIRISEKKCRSNGTIILDMLLNRTPRVQPFPDVLGTYDLVLFVGPVWLGQAASPFRPFLKQIKTNPQKYAFLSISGGAMNDNPKLAGDLKKRAGAEPIFLIDQHIADLLPRDPKPTMKDTSAYKIRGEDLKKLMKNITDIIGEKLKNAG